MSKPLTPEQKANRAEKRKEKLAANLVVGENWHKIDDGTGFKVTRKGSIYNTSDMVLFKRTDGSVVPGFFYIHSEDYLSHNGEAKKGDWFASTVFDERLDDLAGWMEMPR